MKVKMIRLIAAFSTVICLCIAIFSYYQNVNKKKIPLDTKVSYSDATNYDETIPFKVDGDKLLEFTINAYAKEGDVGISIITPEKTEIFNKTDKNINEKIKVKAIKGQWAYRFATKKSVQGGYHLTCKLVDN